MIIKSQNCQKIWLCLFSVHILLCFVISCHFAYAGDERIVQAVQAGFDVDDISLDPCQLQNSSNTGQYMIDMFTIFKNIKIVTSHLELFCGPIKMAKYFLKSSNQIMSSQQTCILEINYCDNHVSNTDEN